MNNKINLLRTETKSQITSHIFIFAALVLFSIITTSCATTLNLRVTRPAQVDSFGAESIAVLPFGTDGSRSYSPDSFTARTSSTASVVSKAVFLIETKISMSGAIVLSNLAVIRRALGCIFYH